MITEPDIGFRILLVGLRGTEVDMLVPRDLLSTAVQRGSRREWQKWDLPHGVTLEQESDPSVLLSMEPIAASQESANVEVLVENTSPDPSLHVAQPWNPVACRCGVVHRSCDPAALVIAVGVPDRHVHFDPDAFVITLAPSTATWAPSSGAIVRALPDQDFGPWARDAVDAIARSLIETGIVGFDFLDIVTVMSDHGEWN
ncbi:MAG: hypothetical protein WCJ30_24335, partial [Deltaproteobacteria bacterium]